MSKHTPSNSSPVLSKGATALLEIDLAAIGANYVQIRAMAPEAECAAVVKADAYGTGAHRVAPALYKMGCRSFFVATLNEGISLRTALRDARIFILDGLFPGSAALYRRYDLVPVLSSLAMLEEWSDYCVLVGIEGHAALHLDTGMNRLGVGPDNMDLLLSQQQKILRNIKLDLIMSHLACADEPNHRRNAGQLKLFKNIFGKLPKTPLSLANSAGVFLGENFAFDLLRPGIALYGGRCVNGQPNPMRPVVELTSYIAQIRMVEKGDAIGYGASYVAPRKTRLATVPIGYADGYHRTLGATNERKGASAYIGDHEAALLGRVSMDLITIDITDIPHNLAVVGANVELLGLHVSVDDLADIAGTISYEILTSLGHRYERHYKGMEYGAG